MRRLLAVLVPAVLVASAAPAQSQVDRAERDAIRQGLVYEGLQRTTAGDPCRGAYRLALSSQQGFPACTHGPDPAPPGVDVRAERRPPTAGGTAGGDPGAGSPVTAGSAQVPCFGNGTDGPRVQLLYARASDRPDNYAAWLPSFQQWAARIDDVFNASAAATGGEAHVRFVHDASCVPVIDNVVLSTLGDDNVDRTINELRSRGYSRSDRRYLVWMEANVYCAIAEIWPDDSPGQGNRNNGVAGIPGSIGRVDKGCWGHNNMAEVHELVHTLGGVQPSAPNGTRGFHCTDEYDRLCYSDGTGFARVICANSSLEGRLDCNNDDYFSTNPAPGSYLANYWNVARSVFLSVSQKPASPLPAPPPTTSTTSTTSTTTTSTTTTSTTTTTTTAPPAPTTTTTTAPPPTGGTVASAPQSFYATQPYPGQGVLLYWSPPASAGSPPFTTYRIYRGASSNSLVKLADVPAGSTSYHDTATTPGALYWYVLKAVNGAGEGPPSNLTRMVAR